MVSEMDDYTGLGAIAWNLFSGEEPGSDYDFFRRAVEQSGSPALDVGCGSGRLLVPLLASGLEVEGIDPSADILDICRRNATRRGLNPVLYQQTMQTLDLPRAYGTIIVPCGTIQLIVERADVFEALRRLHDHLEPGGTLVLTAFNRWEELERERLGEWKLRARDTLSDGTELVKDAVIESRNLIEQTLRQTVRYRRLRDEHVVEEQLSPAPERWYFKHEMELMLEKSGFRPLRVTGNYTDAPVADEHYVMAFFATR